MLFIELLAVLVGIVFMSKIVATLTKTVDILWYIVLGMIGTQYVFDVNIAELEQWATLGVIFIMFYAGWHEDLPLFLREIWRNKWVALIAAMGPFAGALLAFHFLDFTWNESVVAGFVFTATAVPYTVAVLTNLGLEKTRGAKSILASAMADNFISIFLAVGLLPTFALLQMGDIGSGLGGIAIEAAGQIALVVGAFGLFALLGMVILPDANVHMRMNIPYAFQKFQGLRSAMFSKVFSLRRAPGFYAVTSLFPRMNIAIPLTMLLLFGLAWIAHEMGLHPAIAAYLTGLILHAEMYHEEEQDRLSGEVVAVDYRNLSIFFFFAQEWIGPFFFIYLGSQLVIEWATAYNVLALGLVVAIFVAFFQFVTAAGSGRLTAKLPKRDAILLGIGMWPRDVLAFVVLGIAATSGLVSADSKFVTVVIIAILFLNIATSIVLRWFKPRYEQMSAE